MSYGLYFTISIRKKINNLFTDLLLVFSSPGDSLMLAEGKLHNVFAHIVPSLIVPAVVTNLCYLQGVQFFMVGVPFWLSSKCNSGILLFISIIREKTTEQQTHWTATKANGNIHRNKLLQEPIIQWLSFVYVLHICFSFIFLHK